MYHRRNNGKKCLAIKIIKQAFEIISLVTNKNPLEVVLKAIIVAGPREDSTRIGAGGTVKKTAVDVSPLRRINIGDRLILFFRKLKLSFILSISIYENINKF